MFFFHKNRTPRIQDKPVNTVKLYFGDYYRDYGEQDSGGKRLLCVMPYYEDGDPSFGNLARSLGAELLSEFPFVVERLLGDQVHRDGFSGLGVRTKEPPLCRPRADRCIAWKRMT